MNILITGAGGFIGQALAAALMQDPAVRNITMTDIAIPSIPSLKTGQKQSPTCDIETLVADLTSKDDCQKLFVEDLTHAYLLHGIMSGAAEANLELGMRVNVKSMMRIADVLRAGVSSRPRVRVIFPSSLAVFGPADAETEVTEDTVPRPRSSYGTEKAMVELLFNDFSRRGYLDARILRLPTIIVRPGKPTGAASSFCSGIIREPLNGQKSSLPVSKELKLWVCSSRTIISNLLAARDIDESQFGGGSRIVNLPGMTVSVGQMLDALLEVGGQKALDLVDQTLDEEVSKIVESWPAVFDVSRAKQFGFEDDAPLTQVIKDFMTDYM